MSIDLLTSLARHIDLRFSLFMLPEVFLFVLLTGFSVIEFWLKILYLLAIVALIETTIGFNMDTND